MNHKKNTSEKKMLLMLQFLPVARYHVLFLLSQVCSSCSLQKLRFTLRRLPVVDCCQFLVFVARLIFHEMTIAVGFAIGITNVHAIGIVKSWEFSCSSRSSHKPQVQLLQRQRRRRQRHTGEKNVLSCERSRIFFFFAGPRADFLFHSGALAFLLLLLSRI